MRDKEAVGKKCDCRCLGSKECPAPIEGTSSPESTSGPDESELNRVFNVSWFFFTAQTDETDAVVNALGAVPVADVQCHGVPFSVEEQPVRTAVSRLISEAE